MPSRSSKQPLEGTRAEQAKDGACSLTVMRPIVVQRERSYDGVDGCRSYEPSVNRQKPYGVLRS